MSKAHVDGRTMKLFRQTRRSFLKLAGMGAASWALAERGCGERVQAASAGARVEPSFEVDGSTYPWEVHDEGIENILDNMTSMAGINAVYLIALMHQERRPFTSRYFPHNPARAEWAVEDSCVYFHPHLDLYGRIKPAISRHEWLRSTDWLKVVVEAAHNRGMKAGAEISHTPLPMSVLKDHPEFQQRDINNAPRGRFCPNHPDVRDYLVALFGDVARHYDVQFIQTCMRLYVAGGPESGTCFCQSCQREARESGFDLAAAIPVLKANPKAQPQLDQWVALRRNSTTRIYRLISQRIHQEKPTVDFRWNDCWPFGSTLDADIACGLHLDDLKGVVNSCVNQDHTEQKGIPNEDFSYRRGWIAQNRSLLGARIPLLCGVAVRPKATPDLIRKGIQAAVESGINGIACKHYDGATFSGLRAVRDGLAAAGVKGFAPVLGIEAESMTLSGYTPDTYLDESCIKTAGAGTATAKFTHPSGVYDIVVCYAGEKSGQGRLSLSVGGRESLTWGLDEGIVCWKRKSVPQVALQTGDEVKITGVAGGSEGARVDFVEFIARKSRK